MLSESSPSALPAAAAERALACIKCLLLQLLRLGWAPLPLLPESRSVLMLR
jgi:hypothetical protein